ncbi:MAG TPA: alpha/beta hydrolase [Acidimicrobiales bacterium]|jgi:acetyl esterase/lipase|nr:alpha/beta hydrolase [Acidimicrobiales bacterium]
MTYSFDPELAPAVPFLPEVDLADVEGTRRALRSLVSAMPAPDLTGVATTDVRAIGPGGADVAVRIYRPEGTDPEPAGLLYIHGGGFVSGDIEIESGGPVMLVQELGIVVASVDYRLAPEHPYPAGLDDCMAALAWLHGEARDLGIDPARIGVSGQSAGGGLAAAVALRARDEGGLPLCFQFLGIPELDDRLQTASMRRFVDTPMWNRPNAELSWKHYLASLAGDVPYYAAPARAVDLGGLPTAYVSAMEFDPLRDEAIDYAARMLQAGVTVELHVYPGTFHGASAIPGTAFARLLQAETIAALRRGLGLGSPRPPESLDS